ncbi:hypothetical protein Syun_027421 [Stephania yunnanensis]|uniref:Pre-nudix hydrolase domain-containing protein n=1 Tax=Stephania yunnanensis TaxID=152371 RepID=A0AAP0EHW9_9MAGN
MQASCSEELGNRSSASSEEIKEALFCYLIVLLLHLQEHCRHFFMRFQEGFNFHHAEPGYVMLTYWIPDEPSKLPDGPSHQIGIGGLVMNENRECSRFSLVTDQELGNRSSASSEEIKEALFCYLIVLLLHLQEHCRSTSLDRAMRRDIILGIARGVLYLHQDSGLRIVHRYLKASNVLLRRGDESKDF